MSAATGTARDRRMAWKATGWPVDLRKDVPPHAPADCCRLLYRHSRTDYPGPAEDFPPPDFPALT